MKTFIGVKAVQAEPQREDAAFPGKTFTICKEDPTGQWGRPGYKVVYPDGYTSWSPKEVFEGAYVEVPDDAAEEILLEARSTLLNLVLFANGRRFVEAMGRR